MPLTLKNYAKELTKELIQLAEKNIVRECDETRSGHFVAYVDENSESFDVSLTVLPNNGIDESACDCKNGSAFCRHKAALLIHIAKDAKTKATVKIKKKESVMETLLEQTDPGELKNWVKTLIEKNKDIELAFTHHFSAKKQQYTAEDVIKLVKDAIKATAGNKKTIDATQIKKLVELWTEVLQPVVESYQSNVMDEKAFQSFHTLIEQCLKFQSSINTGSIRIAKYVDDTLQKSEVPLNNLLNDETWYKATGYFVEHVRDAAHNTVRPHYLRHLQNIIGICSPERREKLIDILANEFKKTKPEDLINGSLYTKAIFGLVETYNLFPRYHGVFKPLYFDNNFNQKLISLLIENGHLNIAKKYCEDTIKSNYKEEYSVPYLQLLKEIYIIEKNEAGLAKVLNVLFPYSFDFNDYLFIIKRLPADEGKKWRTKMLSKARNSSHGRNNDALEFSFALMNHEGNNKKMISYIDSYTPYPVILKYFEAMFSADKTELLKAIISRSNGGWYSITSEKDKVYFSELFDIIIKNYTSDYFKLMINDKKSDRFIIHEDKFLNYVKKRLEM